MAAQNTRWWVRVLAGVSGGALLLLSFAPYGVWPLAWVSAAVGLWALRGAKTGVAVLVGLVYGAALFFPLVTWTSPFLGPLPWLALATAETLITAVLSVPIAWAYRLVSAPSGREVNSAVLVSLAASALFVVREVVLGAFPYSGFPWA